MLRVACATLAVTLLCAGCAAEPAPLEGQQSSGLFQTPWGLIELDYQWRDGQMVHDGDMVIDPSLEVRSQPGQVAQPLLSNAKLKWEINARGKVRIPYVVVNEGVGAALFDQTAARIRRAMDYWEEHVIKPDGTRLLRFVPHQGETRYAKFRVKHNGGVCQVFLDGSGVEGVASDPSCRWQTYVHEVGHVLTFRHEQKRSDRSTYVTFYPDRTNADGEFSAVGGSYLGTTYDTHSIMHYPSCMFAKASCGSGTPGAWVLERKSGSRYIKPWSERSLDAVLSPKDICGTKKLYGISCTSSGAAAGELGNDPGAELLAAAGTLQSSAGGAVSCVQAAGTGLELRGCDGAAPAQQWELTLTETLRNQATSTCALPGAQSVGPLSLEQCSSGAIQQWRFGEVELINGQSGLCLEVPDEDYFPGQALAQGGCTGAPKQKLAFDAQAHELKARGFCLSPTAAGTLELQECDGSLAQQWELSGGGFASRLDPTACLTGGAKVGLAACAGGLEQQWGLRGQLLHSNDDFCFSSSGAALTLAACDGASAEQRFTWWPNGAEQARKPAAPAADPAELTGVGCTASGSAAAGWLALLVGAGLRRRSQRRVV